MNKDTDNDCYKDDGDDNPTMVENILPAITYYHFDAKPSSGKWKITVELKAQDDAAIKTIKVKIKSDTQSHSKTVESYKFKKTFTVSWDGSGTIGNGWDIYINITDGNDNSRLKHDHIDSIKEVAQKAPVMLAEWIREKVGGWVLEKIKKMFKTVTIGIILIEGKSDLSNNQEVNKLYDNPSLYNNNLKGSSFEITLFNTLPDVYNYAVELYLALLFASLFMVFHIVTINTIIEIFQDLSEGQRTLLYCIIGIIICTIVIILDWLFVKDALIKYFIWWIAVSISTLLAYYAREYGGW